ncbi:MAG: amidohydrolase family protein [Peptococcaceae bacterium]|jgi:guanine deaminase|nr:amidohydrolase family protein [Peptococcaceae bacterium]
MIKQDKFVLKGDICYSRDLATLATIPDGYLICEDGHSRGAYVVLPPQYAQLPLYDYSGRLILPGLVDLHVHGPQFACRSVGLDLELLAWLERYMFPEEAKYQDLAYARAAYGQFAAALRDGPNTRAAVFATCHGPATGLLMDLLEDTGLVTLVGKVNMDRNCPPALRETPESSAQATLAWLAACQGKYRRTQPILTPRFVPSCSDELLGRLGEIQRRHGLPAQSHLSENPAEIAWVKELCPWAANYGDAYRHFGLFGGETPTIMAHCVWSDPAEIALLRENNVFVAHCPQSNMNLASGIAPIRRFLSQGLAAGLGSDVAGGCHASIFRAMSDAIQASKLYWRLIDQSCPPLTVPEAFFLGTAGGGAFFGQVGSFAPGYEADALILDDSKLAAPFPLSIEQRLARLIYEPENAAICHKIVRGSFLW